MHNIVTKYGHQEEDGSFTINKDSARKIAQDIEIKNPYEWQGKWSKEDWEVAFGEAWVSNDVLD